MKHYIILSLCLLLVGCAASQDRDVPQVPEGSMEPEIIISKEKISHIEVPIIELLPGQEDIENDVKQIRITSQNGYVGEITLQDGYIVLDQFMRELIMTATAYNKVITRMIQIYEADLGLDIEIPPFIEVYKTVPFLHQLGDIYRIQ